VKEAEAWSANGSKGNLGLIWMNDMHSRQICCYVNFHKLTFSLKVFTFIYYMLGHDWSFFSILFVFLSPLLINFAWFLCVTQFILAFIYLGNWYFHDKRVCLWELWIIFSWVYCYILIRVKLLGLWVMCLEFDVYV
jgi:hypothetical protein